MDECIQRVLTRLLLARSDEPAKILQYSGRGPLGKWLQVSLTREALSQLRKHRSESSEDSLLSAVVQEGDGQELAYLKRTYRQAFKEAFQQAFSELEAKERTLLRHQVVDGLSIDALGAMHKVHRATAARWLGKIREQLLARTRALLMAQIQVDKGEFEIIMRLIQSNLEVSLPRLLGQEKSTS